MAAGTAKKILIVEDEKEILDLVKMYLEKEGYRTCAALNGVDGLRQVKSEHPDLIILDLMLAEMDGLEVCKRIRTDPHTAMTPIIMLTAKAEESDMIVGLELGADDYVTKPFSLEELVARIRTILRRTGAAAPDSGRLVFEDLELDEDTMEVSRGGTPIELTATEYRLLRYLMLNPRRVMTRAQLLDHVWDYDFGGDGRVLETYISYLRKKLDAHGPPLIRTVRGVGYALQAPRS